MAKAKNSKPKNPNRISATSASALKEAPTPYMDVQYIKASVANDLSRPVYVYSKFASYKALRDNLENSIVPAYQAKVNSNGGLTHKLNSLKATLDSYEKTKVVPNLSQILGAKDKDAIVKKLNQLNGMSVNIEPSIFKYNDTTAAHVAVALIKLAYDKRGINSNTLKPPKIYTKLLQDQSEMAAATVLAKRIMDPKFFTNLVSDPTQLAQAYKNYQQLETIVDAMFKNSPADVRKMVGAAGVISTGKGTIEEIMRAVQLRDYFVGLNSSNLESVFVDLVGAAKGTGKITQVTNNMLALIQQGSSMSGDYTNLGTTDLQLKLKSKDTNIGQFTINLDVKSTKYGKTYQKSGVVKKMNIMELVKGTYHSDASAKSFIEANQETYKLALSLLLTLSNVNIGGFFSYQAVFAIFTALALTTDDFLDSVVNTTAISNNNFPHFVLVNGKFYWYSDLYEAIRKQYLSQLNPKNSEFTMFFSGIDALTNVSNAERNNLINRKMQMRRHVGVTGVGTKRNKSWYARTKRSKVVKGAALDPLGRLKYFMQDSKFDNILSKYWNALNSVSISVNLKINMDLI